MDWSITLVNSLGALITGAAALTTFKIRRIADDFLFDWNDSTFKAAAHVTPSVPLVEVSAALFPGLYKKTVSEAAWTDGDYQGIVRYAPVVGTPVNDDMMTSVRDGKEIDVRIGDVVEGLNNISTGDVETAVGTALSTYTAAKTSDVTGSESVITGAISGLENISTGDVETAVGTALGTYTAAKTSDVTGSESVITGAISGLENISTGDVETATGTALSTYTAAKTSDVTGSESVVTGAISGLENISTGDVETAVGTALGTYTAAKTGDLAGLALAGEAAAALTAYDAATGTDVSTSEGVITGAIGMSEGVITGAVGAVPAATEVVIALAHGSGAYDGLTPPQTLRDAMTMAPTPGVPSAGSVDALLGAIDSKTTNLPSDPADQSAVEAAIATSESNIRDGVETLQTLADRIDAIESGAIHFGASMSDDGTNSRFVAWGEFDHGRATTLTSATAIVRDRLGASLIDLGPGTGPTAEGAFAFSCLSNVLPYNEPLILDVAATDGTNTWHGNVGFVRVR